MRAITKEQAKAIREANINWNGAYPGISIYRPKYGVVIHGVPARAINFNPGYEETDEYKSTIIEWQAENENRNNVNIASIKPLRQKAGTERKKHQSIIIFIDNAEAADRCILNNFLIESQSFRAEKYAPHLWVTQCYKCQNFGHIVKNCDKEEQCGKCSGPHPTAECTSNEHKCANCHGTHTAWHLECPARNIAGERVQASREEQSPLFCE